jgi:hypothetical protein
MEKVYTISPMTRDNDLFEVTIYEDGKEVNEYVSSKENLDKLIEKIEADGYERELTEDQYEAEAEELGWGDDDEDYDILELRDQWDDCDDN